MLRWDGSLHECISMMLLMIVPWSGMCLFIPTMLQLHFVQTDKLKCWRQRRELPEDARHMLLHILDTERITQKLWRNASPLQFMPMFPAWFRPSQSWNCTAAAPGRQICWPFRIISDSQTLKFQVCELSWTQPRMQFQTRTERPSERHLLWRLRFQVLGFAQVSTRVKCITLDLCQATAPKAFGFPLDLWRLVKVVAPFGSHEDPHDVDGLPTVTVVTGAATQRNSQVFKMKNKE